MSLAAKLPRGFDRLSSPCRFPLCEDVVRPSPNLCVQEKAESSVSNRRAGAVGRYRLSLTINGPGSNERHLCYTRVQRAADEWIKKEVLRHPKSLIRHGRFYPLLYCLFIYLFHIRSLLMISQAPDYYTEEMATNSSTGKNRNLFSRAHIKKYQGQYRECSIITLQAPELPKITAISLESGQVCCRSLESVCSFQDCRPRGKDSQQRLCLPRKLHWHSLLWPTAIPQGSLYSFLTPLVLYSVVSWVISEDLISLINVAAGYFSSSSSRIVGKESNAHKIYKETGRLKGWKKRRLKLPLNNSVLFIIYIFAVWTHFLDFTTPGATKDSHI